MADRNVSTCLNRMKIRGRGSSALQITKIQNRGFTMAGQYVKVCFTRVKIGTAGFSRSLITNLYLKYWNS